jgi:predicted transporter
VYIAKFREIKSPVALATLGAFFLPEPFGTCFVIAAAIWWSCRKLKAIHLATLPVSTTSATILLVTIDHDAGAAKLADE